MVLQTPFKQFYSRRPRQVALSNYVYMALLVHHLLVNNAALLIIFQQTVKA